MLPRTFIQTKGLVKAGAMSKACLFLPMICGVGQFYQVGERSNWVSGEAASVLVPMEGQTAVLESVVARAWSRRHSKQLGDQLFLFKTEKEIIAAALSFTRMESLWRSRKWNWRKSCWWVPGMLVVAMVKIQFTLSRVSGKCGIWSQDVQHLPTLPPSQWHAKEAWAMSKKQVLLLVLFNW